MKPMNSDLHKTLYEQLTHRLRQDITSGIYPLHSRIPSENELCRIYDVSRVTVRKALAALEDEGLLQRLQGKGTFVSVPRIRRDLREVNSFTDACRMMGCTANTRVIHVQLQKADDADCAALLCAPGSSVVEVLRLRLADDEPVMLERNRFAAGQYAWLLDETLDGSLYALLQQHGATPGQAIHEVSLCYAGAEEAQLLKVDEGCALLQLNETMFDAQGRPLHTSCQHIRGDRFVFRI